MRPGEAFLRMEFLLMHEVLVCGVQETKQLAILCETEMTSSAMVLPVLFICTVLCCTSLIRATPSSSDTIHDRSSLDGESTPLAAASVEGTTYGR
jgi:hypothetical protein